MDELAALLVLLALVGLALAYARGGWPAVATWFRSKLVGAPAGAPA